MRCKIYLLAQIVISVTHSRPHKSTRLRMQTLDDNYVLSAEVFEVTLCSNWGKKFEARLFSCNELLVCINTVVGCARL